MKQNAFWFGILVTVLALGLVFASCVTVNQKNVANGKFFSRTNLSFYDSSLPVEEYCYFVGISQNTYISSIDGRSPDRENLALIRSDALVHRDILIIPPGEHILSLRYLHRSTRSSGNFEITTTSTAGTEQTVDLSPGHYYFLTSKIEGNRVIFQYDDLRNHSSVWVDSEGFASGRMMPVETIIEGVNAKIQAELKKRTEHPLTKEKTTPASGTEKTNITVGVNQSLIVIKREKIYQGSLLKPSIFIDNKQMGTISNGQETSFAIPNGRHTIRIQNQKMRIQNLEIAFDANSQTINFLVWFEDEFGFKFLKVSETTLEGSDRQD